MISIEQIRNNSIYIKERLSLKGEIDSIDSILSLDKSYRLNISKSNELRAKRNQVSDKIAEAKKLGKNADSDIKDMREVGDKIKSLEDKGSKIKNELNELLLRLPNLPHESVPKGKDSAENQVVREYGQNLDQDFELKSHLELGKKLNLFDFDKASKISGSGFPLYTGKGAKLERALINYMLDFQTKNHDYMEIFPPFMVRSQSPLTTGNLPKPMKVLAYLLQEYQIFEMLSVQPLQKNHLRSLMRYPLQPVDLLIDPDFQLMSIMFLPQQYQPNQLLYLVYYLTPEPYPLPPAMSFLFYLTA